MPVVFTLWQDGFFDEIEGKVHFIAKLQNRVHVVDIRRNVHKINFDEITEVEYVDCPPAQNKWGFFYEKFTLYCTKGDQSVTTLLFTQKQQR